MVDHGHGFAASVTPTPACDFRWPRNRHLPATRRVPARPRHIRRRDAVRLRPRTPIWSNIRVGPSVPHAERLPVSLGCLAVTAAHGQHTAQWLHIPTSRSPSEGGPVARIQPVRGGSAVPPAGSPACVSQSWCTITSPNRRSHHRRSGHDWSTRDRRRTPDFFGSVNRPQFQGQKATLPGGDTAERGPGSLPGGGPGVASVFSRPLAATRGQAEDGQPRS